MKQQLHFTFGPVQEFVSEARKTADLWCGSYLISYLAAHAINGALEANAKEEDFFPRIAGNPLLVAVRWPKEHPKDANDPAASVGSLPNRFSVLVNSDEEGRSFARAADDGLRRAWRIAADACRYYLAIHHYALEDRAGIWDRQVDSLWETSWVISEDHRALAQRKLMRVFSPSEEPGRKCTVCGRREELGNRSFWQPLSRSLGAGFLNADKERLCAVCLVKRTLPRVGREAFGWEVLGESFPSTPDLASNPWRRRVAADSELREARETLAAMAEKPFDRLEGGYFYPSYHEELVRDSVLKELSEKLSALYRVAGAPRPTYAILAMDGDNMGARLSRLDEGGRKKLSERILDFSLKVRAAVEKDGGASRLVYAGGEDVLALLPMDAALDVAWRVRGLYKETFEEFDESHREELEPSTISAGLLYCPMTLPLRTAVREAQHRLLDEDAKDGAGRDALAIGVWKGGGEVLKVARKWEHEGWVEELLKITGEEESPYPSRFLYQAQEIAGGPADDVGTLEKFQALDVGTLEKLLALEYSGSREERFETRDMDEAEERIAPLVRISRKDGMLDPALFRLVRFFYEEGA